MILVVFDLDGTLLHTLVDLANAVNEGLVSQGLPTVTQAQLRSMVGNGAENLCARASGHSGDSVYEQVFDTYAKHYHIHYADNTYAYDGVAEVLDSLANRDVAIGVYSNKNDRAVKLLCDKHFSHIRWAVGRQRGGVAKPDPVGLLYIMNQCGADSTNTVFVGDSTVDIDTAANASVPCISVDWGYNDREKLVEHGATHIASSAQQLIDILSSM